MKKLIKTISRGALELIYPSRCPACDDLLGFDELAVGFCKNCSPLIKRVGEDVCIKCGKSNPGDRELCPDCMKSSRKFEQARAVYEYSGPIKEAMYRYKYANRRNYSQIFASDAKTAQGRWLRAVSPRVILPVPMYLKKRAKRGYNQAEEFGRALSKVSGIPFAEDVVLRTRDTPALKTLGPVDRLKSLRDAFECTKVFRKKADILLVDDIFTTGATADAVSDVLISAGAGRIYCLFICIGAGEDK